MIDLDQPDYSTEQVKELLAMRRELLDRAYPPTPPFRVELSDQDKALLEKVRAALDRAEENARIRVAAGSALRKSVRIVHKASH